MSLADLRPAFRELPLDVIDTPELPSRTSMDERKLEELAADIRVKGVLQPISVVRVGERYEVVAGHRRTLGARKAGRVAVPCMVYPDKQIALEGVTYSENRFRESLNAADEAQWFMELLERDCGGDVDRLCAKLGEKRPYVEGRLGLFQGDPDVFDAIRANRIKIGVGQEINRCTDSSQRAVFLHQAIVGGATVAIVRGWVDQHKRYQVPQTDAAPSQSAATLPGAIAETNFFTCRACNGTDNVHLMRPINFHQHCELAILKPALALFERKGALLAFPRTPDEAADLVHQVLDAFPQLTAS